MFVVSVCGHSEIGPARSPGRRSTPRCDIFPSIRLFFNNFGPPPLFPFPLSFKSHARRKAGESSALQQGRERGDVP